MVYGAPLLQDVAPGRHLGEDERGAARKDTHKRRALSPTERGDTGYPVREDHQRGWPARIRWSEEAQRQKAPFAGGYARDGAQSQGAHGGPPGPSGGVAGAGRSGPGVPWLEASMGRSGIHGHRQSVDRRTSRMERGGGQASAQSARRMATARRSRRSLYRLVRVGSASARAEEVPRPAHARRWVAERTIGWLSQSRRMSKDYERLCETSQAMIHAVMSRLMLRRLARG